MFINCCKTNNIMDTSAEKRRFRPKLIVKGAGGENSGQFEVLASRTESFRPGDLIPKHEPPRTGPAQPERAAGPPLASEYKRAAKMCMTTGEGQEGISIAEAIKAYSEAADFYEAAGDKKGAANACRSLARCLETSGDKTRAAQTYVRAMGHFKAIGDRTSVIDMRANAVACTANIDKVEDARKPPAPVETAAPPHEKALPKALETPGKRLTVKQKRALATELEAKATRQWMAGGNPAERGAIFSDAAALYREIRDHLRSARCEYNAGRGYRSAEMRDKAADAFGRAAELYVKHYSARKRPPTGEDGEMAGHAFHHTGEFMVEKGRWEAGADLFVKAAMWYEKCDLVRMDGTHAVFVRGSSCGNALMMAGRCYMELRWRKQAAEAYAMASKVYRRDGLKDAAKEAEAKARRADGFAARILAGLNELADFVAGA